MSGGATTVNGASSSSAPARGGYARSEVDLVALRGAEQGLELSLALPFGALFSALLPARSFRIRQLHLDYVDGERLGDRATYSVQIGEALEQGRALELRLLVARGSWLCVRGQAVLELAALELAAPVPAQPDQQGNSHG
ncbi:MAG: hypothetical protein RL685_1092 [Pseudomonadota bacterium]|jgi:hypothetical protein